MWVLCMFYTSMFSCTYVLVCTYELFMNLCFLYSWHDVSAMGHTRVQGTYAYLEGAIGYL